MSKTIKNQKKNNNQELTIILRFESNKKHVSIHLLYKLKELNIIPTERHKTYTNERYNVLYNLEIEIMYLLFIYINILSALCMVDLCYYLQSFPHWGKGGSSSPLAKYLLIPPPGKILPSRLPPPSFDFSPPPKIHPPLPNNNFYVITQ